MVAVLSPKIDTTNLHPKRFKASNISLSRPGFLSCSHRWGQTIFNTPVLEVSRTFGNFEKSTGTGITSHLTSSLSRIGTKDVSGTFFKTLSQFCRKDSLLKFELNKSKSATNALEMSFWECWKSKSLVLLTGYVNWFSWKYTIFRHLTRSGLRPKSSAKLITDVVNTHLYSWCSGITCEK